MREEKEREKSMKKEMEREEGKMEEKGSVLPTVYIVQLNLHKTLPNQCYHPHFTNEDIVRFVQSHALTKE